MSLKKIRIRKIRSQIFWCDRKYFAGKICEKFRSRQKICEPIFDRIKIF